MKNIINWTFGGFFRTLGRILCFLVLGTIVGYLLSVSGFNFPSWLKFAYVVNAEVLEQWSISESRYRFDERGTQTWSSFESTPHNWSPTFPVSGLQFRVYATNGLDSQNTYVLKFGYLPNPQSITPNTITIRKGGQSSTYEEINCSQWGYNNNGYNLVSCSFTPRETYSSSDSLIITIDFYQGYLTSIRGYMYGFEERKGTNAVITQTGNQIIENQNENTQDIINNNNQNTQIIMEGQKVCTNTIINRNTEIGTDNGRLNSNGGILNTTSSFITKYIEINSESEIKVLYKLGSHYNCFYTEDLTKISCWTNSSYSVGDTITIPNNAKYVKFSLQKNNANDLVSIHKCINGNQAINDILTDTDTNTDSNDAASFFQDFTLSIEGPISQIVMLPIDLLNILIVDYNANQTHNDLCTTFKGQNICLPSGDIVWKKSGCHDNNVWGFGCTSVLPFRNFLQLSVGGYIIYKLLRKLVESVEKGLDPQSTRVDLMKL